MSQLQYADEGCACDSVLCSHPDCWAPKQRLSWGESKIVERKNKLRGNRVTRPESRANEETTSVATSSRSSSSLSDATSGKESPMRSRLGALSRGDTLSSDTESRFTPRFGRSTTSAATTKGHSANRGSRSKFRNSTGLSKGTSSATRSDRRSKYIISRSSSLPQPPQLTIVNMADVSEENEIVVRPMEVHFNEFVKAKVAPESTAQQFEEMESEAEEEEEEDDFCSKPSFDQERMFSAFKRSTNTKYKPNGELKNSLKSCKVVTMLPPVAVNPNGINKCFLQWAETLQKIGSYLRGPEELSRPKKIQKDKKLSHFLSVQNIGEAPKIPSSPFPNRNSKQNTWMTDDRSNYFEQWIPLRYKKKQIRKIKRKKQDPTSRDDGIKETEDEALNRDTMKVVSLKPKIEIEDDTHMLQTLPFSSFTSLSTIKHPSTLRHRVKRKQIFPTSDDPLY